MTKLQLALELVEAGIVVFVVLGILEITKALMGTAFPF